VTGKDDPEKPLGESNWPHPKDLTNDVLLAISAALKIPPADSEKLRADLLVLHQDLKDLLGGLKQRGPWSMHRDNCSKQLENIRSVIAWLESIENYQRRGSGRFLEMPVVEPLSKARSVFCPNSLIPNSCFPWKDPRLIT
jgi:hypothetical protein